MSAIATPGLAYAPALESASAVTLRRAYGLFIGGAWTAAEGGATYESENPSTQEPLALIARGGASDVDRAVHAARRAYEKQWRKLRPAERAKYIYRFARILGERAREFGILETLDCGKPIRETRDFDVPQAVASFFYHAGWADKLEWAAGPHDRLRPLGVVGAIVPSTLPLLAAAWKIAPALACGNTVVLIPSQTSPLTALLLAQVGADAGLPPGVLNIVTGDAATVAALAEHPGIDRLSFTGSTEAGKALRRSSAGTANRLSLALGGNSALLLFEDAPLDQALESVMTAAYFNAGRMYWGGSRLLVQESIAAEVGERLRERIARLRHGDPLDKNTDVGALGSRPEREALAALIASGIEDGAEYVAAPWTPPERGYWLPASFFSNVQPTYRIAREETLGPVLSLMTFRTADEALERANNVPYGLAAGVWTSNGALALHVAARLRVGVVWCNAFNEFDPSAPFGGYKESGFGREGGLAGLKTYLAS